MKNLIAVTSLLALGAVGSAQAADSSATLSVNGTLEGSLYLTIETAGGSTSGLGSSMASTALGSVSKFGSAPEGFTQSRGEWSWMLSSTIGVKVDKANLMSQDYTLTARLAWGWQHPGVAWRLNGAMLDEEGGTVLTYNGEYDFTHSYAWDLIIDDSASPGSIENMVTFTAISN